MNNKTIGGRSLTYLESTVKWIRALRPFLLVCSINLFIHQLSLLLLIVNFWNNHAFFSHIYDFVLSFQLYAKEILFIDFFLLNLLSFLHYFAYYKYCMKRVILFSIHFSNFPPSFSLVLIWFIYILFHVGAVSVLCRYRFPVDGFCLVSANYFYPFVLLWNIKAYWFAWNFR